MGRIVVTGIGVVSALGNSLHENHRGLIAGKNALTRLELFPTKYAETRYFGEVKLTDENLRKELGLTDKGISRTSLLALKAMSEAITHSQLQNSRLESKNTAIIGANTVGGMCHTSEFLHDSTSLDNPSIYISSYDNGSVTRFLQNQFGIKGISNTINTACSSGANAIAYGAELINAGLADRAIVGGVDTLAKFTINGFNSLHILSPEICRPFDNSRQGLNLGEAAAFLVLEKEEDAIGKEIYGVLTGWSNTNDAYHASSISDNGDGPYLAMKRALEMAELQPSGISYVNAHGTATENNDITESRAMMRLFENVPPFSSTKSYIGHTLGAAGAVEAVYSLISLKHQELYPNLQFEEAIPETGLLPVKQYQRAEVRHVLSNSFGFGGNCSSLIFSVV